MNYAQPWLWPEAQRLPCHSNLGGYHDDRHTPRAERQVKKWRKRAIFCLADGLTFWIIVQNSRSYEKSSPAKKFKV